MWVLGIQLGSFGRAVSAPNCRAVSPAPPRPVFIPLHTACGCPLWHWSCDDYMAPKASGHDFLVLTEDTYPALEGRMAEGGVS